MCAETLFEDGANELREISGGIKGTMVTATRLYLRRESGWRESLLWPMTCAQEDPDDPLHIFIRPMETRLNSKVGS